MTGPLVLGLDVGGTSTRVVVADLDGRVLGTARGEGGNPVSHGEHVAARRIAAALRTALADVDPSRVAAGVIGLAGGLAASRSSPAPDLRASMNTAEPPGSPARSEGPPASPGRGADPGPDTSVSARPLPGAESSGVSAPSRSPGPDDRVARAAEPSPRPVSATTPSPSGTFAALAAVWSDAGLPVAPRLVSDVELAYASGTESPAGSVLVAGTGAVAAECRDFAPIRLADGHGWLLGDRGSGYWLGRAAVQSVLAAIDADGSTSTGLAAAVLSVLGVDVTSDLRRGVLRAAYATPPVHLARLAPVVLDAAAAGDPTAHRLVEQAAGHLLATLATVRAADSRLPVVLAGGVLSAGSPLSTAVHTRVAVRWPAAEVGLAGHAAGAAAWLAARELGAAGLSALHRRLVSTLPA